MGHPQIHALLLSLPTATVENYIQILNTTQPAFRGMSTAVHSAVYPSSAAGPPSPAPYWCPQAWLSPASSCLVRPNVPVQPLLASPRPPGVNPCLASFISCPLPHGRTLYPAQIWLSRTRCLCGCSVLFTFSTRLLMLPARPGSTSAAASSRMSGVLSIPAGTLPALGLGMTSLRSDS